MDRATLTAAAAMWLCAGGAAWAAVVHTDGHGRIRGLDLHGEPVQVRTDLRVPTEGWKRIPNLDSAKDVKATAADGSRQWAGILEPEPGQPYRFEQTLREEGETVRLALRVTADADVKVVGVYFWLDLPVALFGGGTCELSSGAAARSARMPPEKPASRHFLAAQASRAEFTAPGGKPVLSVTLDPACHVSVQDNREWNTPTYSALVRLPPAQWSKGTTATLDVTLRLAGEGDRSPVALSLDATKARYRLDGFGGNYCFGIESPVTQYTLDNLRVAWARTEMTLPEWEPTNDNASPDETNWAFLEGHDQPDTNLRREFLLAQQIQRRGIPYAISIWHLPEWLYANPRKDKERPNRRRVHPDKWPELLEAVGSYLVYAKRAYGVEPDLFSFNEPGIGCRVLFSAEEHRETIKRLGARFAKLGLRTKMLLGDVTAFRRAIGYPLPAAGDPEAMRHVGALAFHSWGGGTPAEYAAWGDLAEKLKLPLLVAELGVDGGAWRGRTYDSFLYGLREVEMYQHVVLYARPQGTMQWEFTSDYGTVKVEGDKLAPTVRFWFVKHFCNLTPPKADALATASDNPKVLLTAFRGEGPVYTLHVANLGAARDATIAGLPAEVRSLRAVQTSEADSFRELAPVAVEGGAAKVQLARQSLLTLTTLPADAGTPEAR